MRRESKPRVRWIIAGESRRDGAEKAHEAGWLSAGGGALSFLAPPEKGRANHSLAVVKNTLCMIYISWHRPFYYSA
jgi:hypothetical protein